jgi:hypothetical protein
MIDNNASTTNTVSGSAAPPAAKCHPIYAPEMTTSEITAATTNRTASPSDVCRHDPTRCIPNPTHTINLIASTIPASPQIESLPHGTPPSPAAKSHRIASANPNATANNPICPPNALNAITRRRHRPPASAPPPPKLSESSVDTSSLSVAPRAPLNAFSYPLDSDRNDLP